MSQKKKKTWTFVPERTRAPTNKRATRRQTTLRAFTFVQDWSPQINQLPPRHKADETQPSFSKSQSQPGSSQLSKDSVRESPIAQLIRSSPGPIIVARKPPGSFRSPNALSPPSSSLSSQPSESSRHKASARRQRREDVAAEAIIPLPGDVERGRTASPGAVSSPGSESGKENRSRDTSASSSRLQAQRQDRSGLHGKGSQTVDRGHERSQAPRTPAVASSDASVTSERSTAKSRSRKRKSGPKLTFTKKSSTKAKVTSRSRLEGEGSVQDISNTALGEESEHSIGHEASNAGQRTLNSSSASRKRQNETSRVHDFADQNSNEPEAESDVPLPIDDTSVALQTSVTSNISRAGGKSSRKKRRSNLTFKKKSGNVVSSSQRDSQSSEAEAQVSSPTKSTDRRPSGRNSSRSSDSNGSFQRPHSTKRSGNRRPPSGRKPLGSSDSDTSSRRPRSIQRSSNERSQKTPGSSDNDASSQRPRSTPKSGKRSSQNPLRSSDSDASSQRGRQTQKEKEASSSKIRAHSSTKKAANPKAPTPTPSRVGRVLERVRTPLDKHMSLIAVTPKSGHVARARPRTQGQPAEGPKKQRGPAKQKGPAAAKKRSSSSEPAEEEPVEKRAKVRLYTTGARPRLVGDTTDLDILLQNLEDTATEFREALDVRSQKKAVTEFLSQANKEMMSMISLQQDFKLQKTVVARTTASIHRSRKELLQLQRENTKLDVRIAAAKKENEKSCDLPSETLIGVNSFLTEIQELHTQYAAKFPADINSQNNVGIENTLTAVEELKSSLSSARTLRSFNNKLQAWLDLD